MRRVGALLRLEEYEDGAWENRRVAFADPCAGEGDAVETLARELMRCLLPVKQRNEERRRAQYAINERERKARRVEQAKVSVETAKRDLVSTGASSWLSEKKRARAVERAEARVRRAERDLLNAMQDAGMEPPPDLVAKLQAPPAPAPAPTPVQATSDPSEGAESEVDADDADDLDAEDDDEDDADDEPESVEPTDSEAATAAPANEPIEVDAEFYCVELERGRHEKLSKRRGFAYRSQQRALHGDAFCVEFKTARDSGAGLLYLNPPYEPHKVFGREEERFLRRWKDALAPDGVLAFVLPYYAIEASAMTLALEFEDVACYRPAGPPDLYKRVVLLAKKLPQPRLDPDPEILTLCAKWTTDGDKCPEVGTKHRRPVYVVPSHDRHTEAISTWKMKVVDVTALLGKFVPWHETTRRGLLTPNTRVLPQFPLVDCLHRTYEVAMPPRPAHIASGLAAGLFNGQRIEPDDPASKLPSLLVKGVFDKEWETIEEKQNKEGEKTGEVQVQAPKLVVTILDLKNHTYHTVKQEAAASAEAPKSAADLSVGDLLAHYGRSLTEVMERQCVILYDPRKDGDRYELVETPRKPFAAQAHAAKAILTVLEERGSRRVPILIGEIGSGKSTTSLLAARTWLERIRNQKPRKVSNG